MAHKPHIPTWPEELPRQRIHEVVDLPPRPCPFDFYVTFREDFADGILPKSSRPHKPVYLVEVEWAWSPANNRLNAYYIAATRKHWVLWNRWFDDNCIPWRWHWQPVGIVPRKGIDRKEAAVHLLIEFWKIEASLDTDHFHWIDQVGLLSVEEVMAIGREVWGPQEDDAESTPGTPIEKAFEQLPADHPLFKAGFIIGMTRSARNADKATPSPSAIGNSLEPEKPTE